jgi:hypothetical protein
MSKGYVTASLRRLVAGRAAGLCEYCLIHESDGYYAYEVEHVLAEKHGGATNVENLAYACLACNRRKGTDVATVSSHSGLLVRLFNPRTDRWTDHFALAVGRIEPLTEIGEATVRILSFNEDERVAERAILIRAGRYPPPEAEAYLGQAPGTV